MTGRLNFGVATVAGLVMLAGCESAHVGMGIPVPGPVKPSVGVTVNKTGIKGTGGVSAKAGSVPVYVGGTTKPVNPASDKK